jgi:translation initiation factor IF-1
MSGDAVEVEGTVIRSFRGDLHEIEYAAGGRKVTALVKRSGRLVTRRINIVAGDVVTVSLSAYDLTRGRIMLRGRRSERAP